MSDMHIASPPGASRPRVAAIIPAWNEETTVASVVHTTLQSPWIDEVVVVDNASTDATAARAAAAGARVVNMPRPGKGLTMAAGVAATDTPLVMFLDADLTGLTPAHIASLVSPVVSGETTMTRGLIDKGPLTKVRSNVLPILSGQRGMTRELFTQLNANDIDGWAVETAMNRLADQRGITPVDVVMTGLGHREKRDKYDSKLKGMIANQKALAETMTSRVAYHWRRRFGGPQQSAVDAAASIMHLGLKPGTQTNAVAHTAAEMLR